MSVAPAFAARSRAVRRVSSAGADPTTWYASSPRTSRSCAVSRSDAGTYAHAMTSFAPAAAASAAARSTATKEVSEPSVPTTTVV